MSKLDQISTLLKGKTGLAPERLLEVAEQAAQQFSASADSDHKIVLHDSVTQDGQIGTQQYMIRRGSRSISSLEVWVDLAASKLPSGPGPITFKAGWSNEVGERATGPSDDNSVLRFLRLYLFGIKGYGIYRQYLDALAEAVRRADPSANVEIVVD
ncbi:MAG: hypothetical protein WD993_03235 [Thermoleophilaceae bacterium]